MSISKKDVLFTDEELQNLGIDTAHAMGWEQCEFGYWWCKDGKQVSRCWQPEKNIKHTAIFIQWALAEKHIATSIESRWNAHLGEYWTVGARLSRLHERWIRRTVDNFKDVPPTVCQNILEVIDNLPK